VHETAADGADEAFGDRVGCGARTGVLMMRMGGGGEHRVERGGERGVAVADLPNPAPNGPCDDQRLDG
jgi:hypothetical protein